jgi:hypothetical protein
MPVKLIFKLTNSHASATLAIMINVKSILSATALTLALASGCGGESHSDAPSVPSDQIHELTRVGVIKAPDGFRNVFYGCKGSDEIFITSAGGDDTLPSTVMVVPNSDYCILDKTPG